MDLDEEELEKTKKIHQNNKKTTNILGTKYTIYFDVETQDDKRLEECLGFTDFCAKEIVISKDTIKEEVDSMKNLTEFKNKVTRHEIVHAFLYESGLRENSKGQIAWAENEEMIDWFAIQSPKILQVYKELNIL